MKKSTLLSIAACLLSMSVTACQKTENETMNETIEVETTEGTSILMETDPVTKNLLYLKNEDTEALIGLFCGNEIDYDDYGFSDFSLGNLYYHKKGSEYDNKDFIFDRNHNGFIGLRQTEGDFFGIILGEDTLVTLTDVLGAPDTLEDDTTETRAIWYFENTTLSATIQDNKIHAIEYLANGNIADAKEWAWTDLGKDRIIENCHVETIYHWYGDWYGEDSTETDAMYYYNPFAEDFDQSDVDAFIQNYLSAQGIDQQIPNGISYDQNGDPFVEYYINPEKEQYCFVIHLWSNYWVDSSTTIRHQNAVYCTTYTRSEKDRVGYFIWEQDNEKNTRQEQMYDLWGNKMAEVSYTYIPEMPLPLIEQQSHSEPTQISMMRNQKFCFYKDFIQFDENGKFVSYAGDEDFYLYDPDPYPVYDTDGKITAIQADPEEIELEMGLDYSGQIALHYTADGTIQSIDYYRSFGSYGSFDLSGYIEYDERGRMIYNNYYVMHGYDSAVFLYEGDSEMPWCVFNLCSAVPSGFEGAWLYLE